LASDKNRNLIDIAPTILTAEEAIEPPVGLDASRRRGDGFNSPILGRDGRFGLCRSGFVFTMLRGDDGDP
jgi:hypothetical protein